jgi:hypothetical protein
MKQQRWRTWPSRLTEEEPQWLLDQDIEVKDVIVKGSTSFILTNVGFLYKKDLKNQDDDKALVIARNISDFCFVSSGIINDNTEFLLLVTKDGQIQQMNLSSLENIKTVRLTEDYIQPRFQSCTSGESHII